MNIYKDVYVKRRLRVRMRANNCTDVEEYLDLAEKSTDEYKRLLNTLTVNVTRFFRNRLRPTPMCGVPTLLAAGACLKCRSVFGGCVH